MSHVYEMIPRLFRFTIIVARVFLKISFIQNIVSRIYLLFIAITLKILILCLNDEPLITN